MNDERFNRLFAEALGRLFGTSTLSEEEEAVARTIEQLTVAGAVDFPPSDVPALVRLLLEQHDSAPVESLLDQTLDAIAREEEHAELTALFSSSTRGFPPPGI